MKTLSDPPSEIHGVKREILAEVYARESPFRPHWPRDLTRAILDPLISRVLALLAKHPPQDQRPAKNRHARQPELEAVDDDLVYKITPTYDGIFGVNFQRRTGGLSSGSGNGNNSPIPFLDGKMRAAGERDTD